jgi:hypothetical protein
VPRIFIVANYQFLTIVRVYFWFINRRTVKTRSIDKRAMKHNTIYISIIIFCVWIPSLCLGQYSDLSPTSNIIKEETMKTMSEETRHIMDLFNNAFQTHNPAELTLIIDERCVMESIQGPDGVRYEGYHACLNFWNALATDPETHFDLEEVFVSGDRATIRWRYHWGKDKKNAVRGVNLMRVYKGKIIEALGYAKTVPATGLDSK